MEIAIILALTVMIVFAMVYALYDAKNNKNLSRRAKVNWNFFIVLVPGTGAVIYFLYKMFSREKQKARNFNLR